MTPVRGIFINSAAQQIEYIENIRSYKDVQYCLGSFIEVGHTFENGDCVFIDGNAATQIGIQTGFELDKTKFIGNALILNHDKDGSLSSSRCGLRTIERRLRYIDLSEIELHDLF